LKANSFEKKQTHLKANSFEKKQTHLKKANGFESKSICRQDNLTPGTQFD